ncbi:hypothetical protein ACUTAH_10150 [Metapseudomonas furukawaii]|uniref:hypothetical protein n=1 Tax=Metapseudomonas furukawaii TaxID=1149133 RepID=UPI0040463E30
MSDNVILRRKVLRDFTTLPNELIRDKRLSWKALGQLVFLLSLPPNFKLSLAYLTKQKKCGRDATRAGLKELESAGYLSIEQLSDTSGRFTQTIWQVSNYPDYPSSSEPCSENPNTVLPNPDCPNLENPPLINTKKEQVLREKIFTTTKQQSTESSSLNFTLSFHRCIPKEDRPALKMALAEIPAEDRQVLLDELAASLIDDVIKTTPLRWLHGLIGHYWAGRFTPSRALSISRLRITQSSSISSAVSLKDQ